MNERVHSKTNADAKEEMVGSRCGVGARDIKSSMKLVAGPPVDNPLEPTADIPARNRWELCSETPSSGIVASLNGIALGTVLLSDLAGERQQRRGAR